MSAATITGLGVRKAAILLIQLGKEHAATVLGHLSDAEVEAVAAEVARLESISAAESEHVLAEFGELMTARAHIAQGGLGFAKNLLEQSLGSERAG